MKIIETKNKDLKHLNGVIVDETKHLFMLETKNGIKKIPKKGNVFQIEQKNKKFEITGDLLLASPEDRIKFKV